jgi:ABC-type nitrate/sulfonate/bicarbonate transport system permease component
MTAVAAPAAVRTTSRGGRRAAARWVAPLIGLGILFALWIIGGRAGWADGMIVTPAEAVDPIVSAETRDLYLRATVATVWSAARGLAIGGTLAFLAALLTATVPSLRRAISRLAAIANSAPWVAVAPCLLVILGRDRGPTAVAALAVFFFVFTATTVGLAAAPPTAHDVLNALGARRSLHVRAVQLPACWPSVMDGLKLAAPAALAGAIFGEWYGAERGLGVLLIGAMQSGRAERLWAASLLSAACGLLAFAIFAGMRRLLVGRFGSSIIRSEEPVRRRSATSALLEVITAVVLAAVLVFAWWAWIELADVSPLVVPRPGRVWDDLVAAPGDYLSAAGATLLTAAIALCLGVIVGAVAATLASRSRTIAGGVVPIIVVLAATPLVALLPLFARVFGYEPTTVRYLAAAMVFFPVFVYTRSGLMATAAPAADALDAMGASPNRRFRLLTVPGAVPHLASGVRVAAGSAIIAAVVGESLIGSDGLGVEFSLAYRQLELPRAFGAAIVIVVVSVLVFAAGGALERAVHSRWS